MANSVVSGNNNANAADILSSAVTTTIVNFSAVGSGSGFTLSDGSGNNLPFGADLMLGALANNGGATQTMLPDSDSLLINAGSNALAGAVATDQRGLGRIFGSAVDIGSVEVQSGWTFKGPAPLDWGASSFGLSSGRMLDIATHPTDPGVWYVATAGGGVWKTTTSGAVWKPLTDQQSVNFMGSVALAPSNPSIIYAGSGEATWGPSKIARRRDNIYYGRGVLKSLDAGTTWTLLGSTEFYRRSIGKIIVHPSDPNTVYLAVGAVAQNGLTGNTGIWKTTNGGTNWTNTTTGISTTAAFSDLVMDPTNPLVLYAAVGDPDGDAANGLYKSTNGGTSWSPLATFPNQNDSRLGRIGLALAPSSTLVLYAWVAASGQSGTSVGNDFQFSRTADGGTTWTARALPGTGVALDYNMALAVDPANANIVYVAGQGSGAPSNSSVRKSTNGATSWSSIGIGATQSPHADHHALVFTSDAKLLDGNDGGIWRLDNPNVGSIEWASRNTDLGSVQFVGVGLHPSDPNLMYAGAQDNGTVKFQNSLNWPVVRGGDGGYVRVDPVTPSTVYHTFFYSGAGFLERSDNSGASWSGKTSGISTATDPAAFYPPYVMDPSNASRLLLGTNRVYQTLNRADSWAPISTPFSSGWNSNAVIDALAVARTNGNMIYASAEGKVFVSTSNGASWIERNVPGASDHFSDLIVAPFNGNVAYIVRDRFDDAGSVGHVWRTADAGVTWTNVTSNLPDIPMYSLEFSAGLPQTTGDDVLYVGTDAGVYSLADGAGAWSVLGTGLPRVQVHDLEYNLRTGILAAATHGRGVWTLPAPAPVGIWTGLGDGVNWNDTLNWSRNTIPGAGNDALLSIPPTVTVVVNDTRSIRGVYSDEDLSVAGTGTLNIGGTSQFAAINIAAGGLMNLNAGGDKVLRARALNITASGELDLFDNDLILDYAGSRSATLDAIQSLINSARNFGAWDGPGITSTSARDNPLQNTTLGAMEASDYLNYYGAGTPFAGQTLDSTAVLVKYTYYGDADFSGTVTLDDYSLIDGGYLLNLTGWLNGDFDGTGGKPDLDDYSLIDGAFLTQTVVL
ncbi:MAG: choice-of-anchor Q domain-containing protein [Tepidisphaeraceae bacterium]